MRSVIALLVFLGAIQGFALCAHLLLKKKENKRAFYFYLLFLFSLSFFNLLYALKILGIFQIGVIPLGAFPLPYKYLIGVGFYFYIKSQIRQKEGAISRVEYLLFLPAFFYGGLRTYWYVMVHSGIDKDLFWRVYQSGFFIYNEYVYLLFSLVLAALAVQFLKKNRGKIGGFNIVRKNWEWLLRFSRAFILILLLNLLLAIIVHIVGDAHNGMVYAVLLILNSAYIYWVGFECLTQSKFLFNTFSLKNENPNESRKWSPLGIQLERYMSTEEVFTDKNLKIAHLARMVNTTDKELSLYIHESFGVSFSEYVNHFRVGKVKRLLDSGAEKKYTLLAIAEKAGFNSKSSFNSVFKKATGLTPTQYKAALKN